MKNTILKAEIAGIYKEMKTIMEDAAIKLKRVEELQATLHRLQREDTYRRVHKREFAIGLKEHPYEV